MQAVILMALPPVLFVGLLLFKRDYVQVLLGHPGLLIGAVVCQVAGALWVRQITRFNL
jgi:Flp pilus assembly protein TadB